MPAVGHVEVHGLRELNAAFKVMDRDLAKDLRDELKDVGEPVRGTAESLARANIRNIGDRWPRMRLGVTSRLVYVAPKSRTTRRGTPRPNLAGLLLNKAMLPALASNESEVVHGLDGMLDRLADKGGF